MKKKNLLSISLGFVVVIGIFGLISSMIPPTIPDIPVISSSDTNSSIMTSSDIIRLVESPRPDSIVDDSFIGFDSIDYPESNDSLLLRVLDESQILPPVVTIDIKRTLGDDVKSISQLTLTKYLSFITEDNILLDLTDKSLSLSFQNQQKIEYGSALVEIIANGKSLGESRYDLKSSVVGKEITISKNKIESLLINQPDGLVKIEINIKELYIRTEAGLFSLPQNIIIYSISLQKDSYQLLYKTENGSVVKMYPKDGILRIGAYIRGVVWYKQCVSCEITGHSAGIPTPHVGVVTVTDSLGNIVYTSEKYIGGQYYTHTGWKDGQATGFHGLTVAEFSQLQRNSVYHIHIDDGAGDSYNDIDFDIITPKSQRNYNFGCYDTGCDFPDTKLPLGTELNGGTS